MWVLVPCNLWAWCLTFAAVHLQRWRGRHAQCSGHLCKHLSRCLHAPESACALAMAPAHLDYSCTVVTSLSYPGILTSGNDVFLYIFHFQMVADNIFGKKLLYLGLRGLEQVFELSTLVTRRKSTSTGWNFLFFPLQWGCSSMPGEFHCCASQLVAFSLVALKWKMVWKPEVVLPKQPAKNISTAKRQA